MKINTLVTHKTGAFQGIGCIAKIMKANVVVNVGEDGYGKFKPEDLILVDTSKCKTVSFKEVQNRIMQSEYSSIPQEDLLNWVIVGNVLKHYIGIGWITNRVVTLEDLTKYPRVV